MGNIEVKPTLVYVSLGLNRHKNIKENKISDLHSY